MYYGNCKARHIYKPYGHCNTAKTLFLLARSKASDILLALLKRPRHITELQLEVKGSLSTIEARVNELINDGLVSSEELGRWPFRRVLTLSDKGLQLAGFLERMKGVLGGELTSPRARWILALLYAAGGEVKGSTRLEKLLFLLSKEGHRSDGSFYAFNWYKFGPFSSEALNDAHELHDLRLINIEEEMFVVDPLLEDYRKRTTYCLTSIGKELAKKIFDSLSDYNKKVLSSCRKYVDTPLKDLLDYVYSRYAEATEKA
jgi:DNA-binding HxlR family transcriptional regulator/uncharacterized protein YwgA